MAVFPFIIDSRPSYLRDSGAPRSLLLAPLGVEVFLGVLRGQIGRITREAITVVPTFEPDTDYEQAVREAGLTVHAVVPIERFGRQLASYEPSDWLLLMDPRRFPAGDFDLAALLENRTADPCAKHLVAMESGSDDTKEYVHLDANGNVRRIQRYYEGVTWLCTSGVIASLVSVSSARLVSDMPFTSLSELRQSLSVGAIPSQDIPLPGSTVDLTDERGLLGLAEQMIVRSPSHNVSASYTTLVPGVRVGQRCRIHPSTRIYGPVVVQSDVVIEPDVVVIGPTVLGSGSRVRRNSVIAQCVVLQGSEVSRETTVRHRVIGDGRLSAFSEEGVEPVDSARSRQDVRSLPGGAFASTQTVSVGRARRSSLYPQVKRVMDVGVALLGLLVLSPLLLIAAVLIKLTSRGPVLYGDEREGKDGRVFRCWKFRTMVEGAHNLQRRLYGQNTLDGPQFKLRHDPRVTGIGHWLRLANIDELPQLINVVAGQMSLIGPRPSPFRENQICVPWRKSRLSVRPGITGLWQVCRHERAAGDFHQWIHYDMLYVRHMSLWLDLKILISTVLTMGGRWSVPVSRLIPADRLHDAARTASIPMWIPFQEPTAGQADAGAASVEVLTATRTMNAEDTPEVRAVQLLVRQLRSMAIRGLARMYRPSERLFAFRIRRDERGEVLEGVSRRYTAITLIGLASQPQEMTAGALAGQHLHEVCARLLDDAEGADDLGEVALVLWAARVLGHPNADKALQRLRLMDPARQPYPTVELAWSLLALLAGGYEIADEELADALARRLLGSFRPESGLFPHWPQDAKSSFWRRHIGCFADQVYPIQAMSHYHMRTGNAQAGAAAQHCANVICSLQGRDGQWWWHYDVRSGKVVEGYPVYSVHQDAMAPMALFALREACGVDYGANVIRGLKWLMNAPETASSLIDVEAELVWRKVARHEPRKLARFLQGMASLIHPSLRVPLINTLMPPHSVDYECRPYHFGWLLCAWSEGETARLSQAHGSLSVGDSQEWSQMPGPSVTSSAYPSTD